jgi:hypothetical protein
VSRLRPEHSTPQGGSLNFNHPATRGVVFGGSSEVILLVGRMLVEETRAKIDINTCSPLHISIATTMGKLVYHSPIANDSRLVSAMSGAFLRDQLTQYLGNMRNLVCRFIEVLAVVCIDDVEIFFSFTSIHCCWILLTESRCMKML